jgi:predicted DNA-binding transcriptional regulator AlpA
VKTELEPQDIEAIADRVIEKLKPLIMGNSVHDTEDRVFTVEQLSEYIGLSKQWIYNNKKNIPHFNRKRKPLFRKSEIDRWLETFKKEPGSSSFRNITATESEALPTQQRAFKRQKSNATTSL